MLLWYTSSDKPSCKGFFELSTTRSIHIGSLSAPNQVHLSNRDRSMNVWMQDASEMRSWFELFRKYVPPNVKVSTADGRTLDLMDKQLFNFS